MDLRDFFPRFRSVRVFCCLQSTRPIDGEAEIRTRMNDWIDRTNPDICTIETLSMTTDYGVYPYFRVWFRQNTSSLPSPSILTMESDAKHHHSPPS